MIFLYGYLIGAFLMFLVVWWNGDEWPPYWPPIMFWPFSLLVLILIMLGAL